MKGLFNRSFAAVIAAALHTSKSQERRAIEKGLDLKRDFSMWPGGTINKGGRARKQAAALAKAERKKALKAAR